MVDLTGGEVARAARADPVAGRDVLRPRGQPGAVPAVAELHGGRAVGAGAQPVTGVRRAEVGQVVGALPGHVPDPHGQGVGRAVGGDGRQGGQRPLPQPERLPGLSGVAAAEDLGAGLADGGGSDVAVDDHRLPQVAVGEPGGQDERGVHPVARTQPVMGLAHPAEHDQFGAADAGDERDVGAFAGDDQPLAGAQPLVRAVQRDLLAADVVRDRDLGDRQGLTGRPDRDLAASVVREVLVGQPAGEHHLGRLDGHLDVYKRQIQLCGTMVS